MKFQNTKHKNLIPKLLLLTVGLIFLLPQFKAQSNEDEVIRNFMNTQGVGVGDYLIDDEGYLLTAGMFPDDFAYLSKVDTALRTIVWDTSYHADKCGLEAHNQYSDIKQHPEGGYLVTKLIHECGTSGYDTKVIHVSKDGEFLKEGSTHNKGIPFPSGYGGNEHYRDIIIRDDGHILTLWKPRYIGQNGNLEAIIEFDENLEFVKFDTSMKNHNVRLHADDKYLYAYGRIQNQEQRHSGPFVLEKFDLYSLEKIDSKVFHELSEDPFTGISAVFDENVVYLSHVYYESPSYYTSKLSIISTEDFEVLDDAEFTGVSRTVSVQAIYDDFLVLSRVNWVDSIAEFVFMDKHFKEIKTINALDDNYPYQHGGRFGSVKLNESRMTYVYSGLRTSNPGVHLHFFEIDLEELNLVSAPERAAIDTEVRLFPNPSATGNFELVSEERFNQINVFTVQGKLIKTYQHRGNRFEFNLNESGIYLIQTILQNGNTQTFKAVKL